MAGNLVHLWATASRKNPLFWVGFGICAVFVFSSIFLVNVLIVGMAPLYYINKKWYRRYCDWFGYTGWPLYVHLLEIIGRNDITFYGENVPKGENAIVLLNHQSYVDWLMSFTLGFRKDRIGGIKIAIKDVIKYVPAVGTAVMGMGFVLLSRKWESDQRKLSKAFEHLTTHKDIPFWFVSHPEGSRVSKQKLKESQDFAKKRDLPILHHVLLPRIKGFVSSVNSLRENTDAIYDITTIYSRQPDLFVKLFAGLNPIKIHMYIRRFPMDSIPKDEAGLTAWIYNLYKEKDDAIDYFEKNGTFPAKRFEDPLNLDAIYQCWWKWIFIVYIPGWTLLYFISKLIVSLL